MQERLGISNSRIQRIRNYDYRVMDVVHVRVESTCIPRNDNSYRFGFSKCQMSDAVSESWITHRKSEFRNYFELKGKDYIVVLHSDSMAFTQILATSIAVRIAVRTERFSNLDTVWLIE